MIFGVMNGITSAFDLAPVESRQAGIPLLAVTAGVITTILGMLPLSVRLGEMLRSGRHPRE